MERTDGQTDERLLRVLERIAIALEGILDKEDAKVAGLDRIASRVSGIAARIEDGYCRG